MYIYIYSSHARMDGRNFAQGSAFSAILREFSERVFSVRELAYAQAHFAEASYFPTGLGPSWEQGLAAMRNIILLYKA